jgi:hypothetical protein
MCVNHLVKATFLPIFVLIRFKTNDDVNADSKNLPGEVGERLDFLRAILEDGVRRFRKSQHRYFGLLAYFLRCEYLK